LVKAQEKVSQERNTGCEEEFAGLGNGEHLGGAGGLFRQMDSREECQEQKLNQLIDRRKGWGGKATS